MKGRRYSIEELGLYFLRLGATGFGGPAALVAYMHRDLVEARAWISEEEYKDGLALAQLSPGPLAAQLSMYIGFVHHGVRGATLAGAAFVLPSFLMVVALGWTYARFGGLAWVQPAFHLIGAAVIGIIVNGATRLCSRTLGRRGLLWAVFLAACLVTAWTESEWVALFLGAGVLVWLVEAPPRVLGGFAARSVEPALLGTLFAFFAKAGAFVFGSGLAIVPFLYGGVVREHRWLTDRQFLDAVAVAMITPGPVVITVGFIGYLVAGLAGACAAAAGTFLPCYLFTVLPAPYFKRYGKRPAVAAFVDGVTAAAVGTIAGAVVVLGRRSVGDLATGGVALASAALVWRRVPEPLVILAAGVAGVLLFPGR